MKRNNNTLSLKATSPKLLKRYVRLLLWLHGINDKEPYIVLTDRIIKLILLSGRPMAVAYLKGAKLALDHYISGNPVKTMGHAPRIAISKPGIPLIIPPSLRLLIEKENVGCIKVVLGLLSIFRVIPLAGKPKLETITGPFTGLSTTLNPDKLKSLYDDLFSRWRGSNPLGKDFPLPLSTAGPNFKISILGATSDAYAFDDTLLKPFTTLSRYFGAKLHLTLEYEKLFSSDLGPKKEFKLGKLSAKQEAAGKVRIFAIVDVWTQTVLQPIHKHVFSILKRIPNDGCFDQEAPLKRLISKGLMNTYSYDLSAATDRFPIDLQVQILSLIYTKEVAECWKELLINRDYWFKDEKYRYSVGQPMGALSSWGVFSLAHHFVVQYAARKVGYTDWFDDYALLGDDIVIANKDVAREYHEIMTEILGVEINLSKSIQSDKGVMEFAKRLVSPLANFSPVGPKNVTLSLKAPSHISTLVIDYIQKGGVLYEHATKWMLKLTADIVKISSGNKEALVWSIIGPFGHQDSGDSFGPSRVENSLTLLHYWDTAMNPYSEELGLHKLTNQAIDEVILEDLEKEIEKAKEKTIESIFKYRDIGEVPGFNSDTLLYSPTFRNFYIGLLYRYFELCELEESLEIPKIPHSEVMTISDIVKSKFDKIHEVYPVSWLLEKDEPKRPRFRKVNLNFFSRVNIKLKELEEARNKSFTSVKAIHQAMNTLYSGLLMNDREW